MRQLRPPIILREFRGTVLHLKMEYAGALLRWALNWLNEVQDMSLQATFDGLAKAKSVRRTAASLEKAFEEAALAEMFHAGQSWYVGPDYEAIMRPGRDRKAWKHSKVMESLIDANVERMKERFPYVEERLLRTLVTESMWEVYKHGRIEWRSTDLRASGLDPDDFSQKTSEKPTIDLRGKASHSQARPRRPRGI